MVNMSNAEIDRAVAEAYKDKPAAPKSKIIGWNPKAGTAPDPMQRQASRVKAQLQPDTGDVLYDSAPKVPSASQSGRQEGVPPPSERQMRANYEAVDADEAMKRARDRRHGVRPIIKGGVDDLAGTVKELSEPSGAILAMDESERPMQGAAMFEVPAAPPVREQPGYRAVLGAAPTPSVELPLDRTLRLGPPVQKKRVTLSFPNGVYSMPCVDVKECDTGIMILLQSTAEDARFTPAAGTRFVVGLGGKSWSVYYPGLCFEMPEHGLVAMALLHDTSKQEGAPA